MQNPIRKRKSGKWIRILKEIITDPQHRSWEIRLFYILQFVIIFSLDFNDFAGDKNETQQREKLHNVEENGRILILNQI
jgi:hypothetical protein